MNSLYKLIAMSIIMAIAITCKRQQAEPIPEVEQTLFENIEPCCKLIECDFNDPLVAKLYSDSMTIWNATAILDDNTGGMFRINIKNNYIDPKRFPGWGDGNVALFACNIPTKLKHTGKYQKIELDFRLLYFIPPPGADYSGYPVDLLRVKVLGEAK